MAVSPLKSPAALSGPMMVTAKARALTVLNKKPAPSSASTPTAESDLDVPQDLAEQLNQQESDKYVKGTDFKIFQYSNSNIDTAT